MSIEALSRGQIRIRIDKPTPPRVIVPALQIVQPRLRVVDIPTVAQGVLCAEGGGQRAGGGQRVAPCVVGVARGDGSLRRFRQAVVRSSLEYLRAILFSRTDNSHILTKETTMCQHALPLLYHVTCQEHPETPLCVGIIPTFRSSFIAKLQYSSS